MIYLALTFISQPEENLVTCLAHLEYRGLHCIVLQLLDTNIRQVVIILIVFINHPGQVVITFHVMEEVVAIGCYNLNLITVTLN